MGEEGEERANEVEEMGGEEVKEHGDIHTRTHTHACTHAHTHAHTRTYTRTHAHAHTHTHSSQWPISCPSQ